MTSFKDSKKEENNLLSHPIWEYKILNLKVDSNKNENHSTSPEIDSKKLKGAFSPSFIKEQFPEQYKNNVNDKHPADQMCGVLNLLGKEGWELVESTIVGSFQFFIFKRKKLINSE